MTTYRDRLVEFSNVTVVGLDRLGPPPDDSRGFSDNDLRFLAANMATLSETAHLIRALLDDWAADRDLTDAES